jgi:putative ABC transport system permease protein
MQNGKPVKLGSTLEMVGRIAKDECPAVEDMCRIFYTGADIQVNNIYYMRQPSIIVDANFFTFFSFRLKQGDPENVLSAPNKAVISETVALRFFSGQDPVGQTFRFETQEFEVSGVMKNIPSNSSLQADIVFTFPPSGVFLENPGRFDTDAYITFFLMHEKSDIQSIEEQVLQTFTKKYPEVEAFGFKIEFEPLNKMHFSTGFIVEYIRKGNKQMVIILAITALVILVISCINFINLFISTSFIRAGAIAIKKVHGANKWNLIREFYIETAFYALISIAIGLWLAQVILPVFNNFTQSSLAIDYLSIHLYLFIILLFTVTVFLAGTIPAFHLTHLNIAETLKGKYKGKQMSFLPKCLIVLQFTASIALLIVVIFMQKQVNFVMAQDLGFNKENVLYVQGYNNFSKNYDAIRGELLKYPAIRDITMKTSLPTVWAGNMGVKKFGSDDVPVTVEMCPTQPNYFDFFEMRFIAGENPFRSNQFTIDVVVNERCAELLGLDNPLEQFIDMLGHKMPVRGVIRNAQVRSFHTVPDPQMYVTFFNYGATGNPIFFKIAGNPQQAIGVIEQAWKEKEPDYPFEYHFLDETYQQLYSSEMNTGKVLKFAIVITFMISVAGLFATAFYSTQRRRKEIAIRKVHGASVSDLLLLLNKNFIVLILIAFVLGSVAAWFFLEKFWLKTFIVQAPLSIGVFAGVGLVACAVALLTVSWQTWSAATTNPVEVIKKE